MRQLVLLRHAKAAADSDSGEDFDRALAPRGRSDAPGAGMALAQAGADPEVVLVSAARRTRETWELAAAAFKPSRVKFVDALYLAAADIILRQAEDALAERVMIVAHNPGLHELASRLAHRMTPLDTKVRARFPTAAGAIFERADVQASWKLKDYITPKDAAD